ncbi:MAG: YfhO family protein, partial [Bryobacteraceae bacterium]
RNNAEPGLQQILSVYRQSFPVSTENEDFVVFRNDAAHPYITAYARACLYVGDVGKSAVLALALSAKNWPLVQAREASVTEVPVDERQKFENVYAENGPLYPPTNAGAPVVLENVQLARESSEVVRIQLNAPSACLAVIAESYYPFWHAEIDGQPTDVLQVSCGVMGVELPAGSHTIVLRYEPPRAYAIAGFVSVATLLLGLGYAVRERRRATS